MFRLLIVVRITASIWRSNVAVYFCKYKARQGQRGFPGNCFVGVHLVSVRLKFQRAFELLYETWRLWHESGLDLVDPVGITHTHTHTRPHTHIHTQVIF
jgi:hypothetical protein